MLDLDGPCGSLPIQDVPWYSKGKGRKTQATNVPEKQPGKPFCRDLSPTEAMMLRNYLCSVLQILKWLNWIPRREIQTQ